MIEEKVAQIFCTTNIEPRQSTATGRVQVSVGELRAVGVVRPDSGALRPRTHVPRHLFGNHR